MLFFFFFEKKHLEGARLLRSELPPSSSDQQIGLDGIVKSWKSLQVKDLGYMSAS